MSAGLKSESVRSALRAIEEAGAKLVSIDVSRKHPRLVFEAHGKQQTLTVSGTTVSVRAIWNQQALIRRLVRASEPAPLPPPRQPKKVWNTQRQRHG